jgi:hypothetical protein
MSSVHKQILEKVPNAIEGRDSPANSVFGMKGIPESVYISWLTSVDPEFKENTKDVTLDGAFFANDATRFAAMSHMASSANVTFNQVNQFLRANVQVNQGIGTVVTAKGVVATDTLQKSVRRSAADDPATAQRRYEIAMRRAKEIIDEATEQAVRERKRKMKEQKKSETMYFKPVEGLTVFEMRARFLMSQHGPPGGDPE